LTRWYNAMLEQVILGAPEQYWWVHRRWKGEPPGKRAVAKTAQSDGADTIPMRAKSESRPYLSHRKAA
jgi:lauroyl/myristoyl acyltransferase